MKKFKEKTQETFGRILGVNKEEEKPVQTDNAGELSNETYAMCKDPVTRAYSWVKIKFDPKTKQAVIEAVVPCLDKTTGYAILLDTENRKYLFDKANSGGKR